MSSQIALKMKRYRTIKIKGQEQQGFLYGQKHPVDYNK